MNFYGHATFAARIDTDPGYVLGSMLPDFEGMCGVRLDHASDSAITRGIALHHATDEAFHHAAPFLTLCAEGLDALVQRGVPRAPARACAHVGTELVYDAHLLATRGPESRYVEALRVAARDARGAHLAFRDGGERFEALRLRLAELGVPYHYAQPGFVADRLYDALVRRPRLALDRALVPEVAAWLDESIPRIHAHAPQLDAIVSRALGLDDPSR